jgi:hypothetical protein
MRQDFPDILSPNSFSRLLAEYKRLDDTWEDADEEIAALTMVQALTNQETDRILSRLGEFDFKPGRYRVGTTLFELGRSEGGDEVQIRIVESQPVPEYDPACVQLKTAVQQPIAAEAATDDSPDWDALLETIKRSPETVFPNVALPA